MSNLYRRDITRWGRRNQMPQDSIFRENALAKLSSPEQLDQLIIITDKRGWLAILAVGLILIAALLWAVWGRLPIVVSGRGILIAEGGIREMIALNSGTVKEMKVELNDTVEANQVIATVSNPEMEYELVSARNQLEELKKDKSSKNIEKIKDMESNIGQLEGEIKFFSEIRSPSAGIITSLRVGLDDYVDKGAVIATIERNNDSLAALVFISDEDAKRIQAGMDVQVSPSTVKKEEYGYMSGKVAFISQYPTTRKRVLSIFDNDQLADSFIHKNTATFVARVSLQKSSQSKSGYKWSSNKEPDLKITSGTLCDSSIVIREIRPISIAFPQIK